MTFFLDNVSFKLLRYFAAVAETANFGLASSRLQISQPRLSQAVKRLERELETELFIRHPKVVSLTLKGRILLEEYYKIARCNDIISRLEPPVSFGINNSFGFQFSTSTGLFASIHAEIGREWPEDTFSYVEASSFELQKGLAEGLLDYGIMYDPEDDGSANQVPLIEERLVLVGSPSRPELVSQNNWSIRALRSIPLVLPTFRQSHRRLINKAEKRAGISLQPILEVDSPALTLAVLRAGTAFTLAPSSSFSKELRRGELVRNEVGNGKLKASLCLSVSSRNIIPSERSKYISDLVVRTIKVLSSHI